MGNYINKAKSFQDYMEYIDNKVEEKPELVEEATTTVTTTTTTTITEE